MRSEIVAFAASFVIVGLASASMPGCIRDDGCSATPDRPPPSGPIGNMKVIGYDDTLIQAPLSLSPQNGTVQITGETVVIQYTQDAVNYRVEYKVLAPYSD
jgi:hypothetical protein